MSAEEWRYFVYVVQTEHGQDIYNPEEWGVLMKNWLAAKKAAEASS